MILCDDSFPIIHVAIITCDVCLYEFNYRKAEQIFMKYDVDVMPLESTSNLYFLISYSY
jgi:hypothetical protein